MMSKFIQQCHGSLPDWFSVVGFFAFNFFSPFRFLFKKCNVSIAMNECRIRWCSVCLSVCAVSVRVDSRNRSAFGLSHDLFSHTYGIYVICLYFFYFAISPLTIVIYGMKSAAFYSMKRIFYSRLCRVQYTLRTYTFKNTKFFITFVDGTRPCSVHAYRTFARVSDA